MIYLYKTIIIPVKCNKTDYTYLMTLNKLSAEVWNHCIDIDKEYVKQTGNFMTMGVMQTAVKGYNNLHAKGISFVYHKYLAARESMWKSIKAKHENSNKVKLPYRYKKYYNTGWDYQSIKIDKDKGTIEMSRSITVIDGKRRRLQPICCYAKTIPDNIVEIELLYRNGLYLAIKYKTDDKINLIQSTNSASIDLGEIHAITSIDTQGNAIIITGRKLRSIKRLRDKEQSAIKSKRSKCTKGSLQYKKYSRAIYKIKHTTDNQILDAVHKITKLYLDYCLRNQISTVYYGDLDHCTRNTKGRVNKEVGQKLNEWNYGLLMRQLENKLSRYGIQLVKISEAYTSQTCPVCGKRNHPTNRIYKCECDYKQHRDIVGAINILNNNAGTKIQYYNSKEYLRIA